MKIPIHILSSVASTQLPKHSFLSGVHVLDVRDGTPMSSGDGVLDAMAMRSVEQRQPGIESNPSVLASNSAAVLAIPVFRNETVVSVVLLVATKELPSEVDVPEPVGVFEVWRPVGPYEEVALSAGYYGKMERFANVSSFVRFECGTGLPGQVWDKRQAVIHDDLSNHPGFLRAAGASADLLQTAVGIPICVDEFIASVLLITSHNTPIARGFEVWHSCGEGFELFGASYVEFDPQYSLAPKSKLGADESWAGLIRDSGGAVLTDDPTVLLHQREISGDAVLPRCGLAIPQFDGNSLDSFLTLLF